MQDSGRNIRKDLKQAADELRQARLSLGAGEVGELAERVAKILDHLAAKSEPDPEAARTFLGVAGKVLRRSRSLQ
jgi:polyhydroxyalkanoate synthesis regulator phasin